MPTQDFRDSRDNSVVGRAMWSFSYDEIYISFEDRTFQLHNVNELRTEGVHIGVSVSDELFVYLASTRDGERFQLSLNGVALVGDAVDFATSPNGATISALKVTAHVAQPGKGTWKQQAKVEIARRWCRALASAFAGIAFYFTLKSDQLSESARISVLIAFGGAAAALVLVDLLSKWDIGARLMMLIPPLIFGFCAYRTFTTYMELNDNQVILLSPQTAATLAMILLLVTASFVCLAAQGSAKRLYVDAREHRKINPPSIG